MPFDNYTRLPVTAETIAAVTAARVYLPPTAVQTVLFHSTHTNPCNDGSAAAMGAWKVLGDNAEYIPYNPQAREPFDLNRLAGKNVLMIDCSMNAETLAKARTIVGEGKKVMIMDHHMPEQVNNKLVDVEGCYFSADNSAGAMGWLYFNGLDATIPLVVDLVQRQDVLKLSNGEKITTSESDQVAAALRTFNGFDQYKTVYAQLLDETALEALRQKGAGIIEANRVWVAEMAAKAQLCKFNPNDQESYTVVALQLAPEKMREVTEVGETIWRNLGSNPDKVDFVMFWCPQNEGETQLSLRSKFRTGMGLDVAALAKKLAGPKGGGHNEAAGATLKLPENFLELILKAPAPVADAAHAERPNKILVTAAAVGAMSAVVATGAYLMMKPKT